MFGQNPKRPPLKGDGTTLEIQEIFATIQGEGLYAGWPSVFIRLGGCNLACNFCDTEFESYTQIETSAIIKQTIILANGGATKLVVITGGEPLRQPINNLCTQLLEHGFMVQIETNGTIYQEIDERVDVVCSPKNQNGTYTHIRPDLLERISAFKFIISAHDKNYSNIAEVGQENYGTPVYVQPMDEYNEAKNIENINLAVKLAMDKGCRLSMQLHKLIGLR
jgi:organic radical activating enzyme